VLPPKHCNTLQHTAIYCITPQRTELQQATVLLKSKAAMSEDFTMSRRISCACTTLHHTITHCNTLLHTAIHCNRRRRFLKVRRLCRLTPVHGVLLWKGVTVHTCATCSRLSCSSHVSTWRLRTTPQVLCCVAVCCSVLQCVAVCCSAFVMRVDVVLAYSLRQSHDSL